MDVLGIKTAGFEPPDAVAADVHRFISRVVQQLDLQFVLRVIELRDGIQQAVHHMHLVEHRQLHGYQRQLLEQTHGMRPFAGMLQIEKYDRQAVRAVAGKTEKHQNVGGIPNRRSPVHGSEEDDGLWWPDKYSRMEEWGLPGCPGGGK